MGELLFDAPQLEAVLKRYHVVRLAVFGSFLHGEQRPDSDLDLLVEFEPGKTPGLKFIHLQDELSSLFGRRVDLNTAGFLSRYFRHSVISEARSIYGA